MEPGDRIGAGILGVIFTTAGAVGLSHSARNLADSDGELARYLYDAHDAVKLLNEPAVQTNIIVRENLEADAVSYFLAAKKHRPDVPVEPYIRKLETLQPSQKVDWDFYNFPHKYDASFNQAFTGAWSLVAALGLVLLYMCAKDTVANVYQRLRSRLIPAKQSSS